jgi:hypothetical protein
MCRELASLPADVDTEEQPGRLMRVPVAYGGAELGPDLSNVAALTHMTEEEVVARHSQTEYRVYFVGFTVMTLIVLITLTILTTLLKKKPDDFDDPKKTDNLIILVTLLGRIPLPGWSRCRSSKSTSYGHTT